MNKKKIVKYSLSIIAICLVISIIYIIYICFFCPVAASRIDEFKTDIEQYTNVAQAYYSDYSKYDADSLIYSVSYDNDKGNPVCLTEKYDHTLSFTKNELNDLAIIQKSYRLDKQPLDYIAVYNGFVSFCNNNHRASYVYSVNDSKPKYISTPTTSNDRLYISKISDNWYFVSLRR